MPVLPLTPLSLTASVNLFWLQRAFIILSERDFTVSCGSLSGSEDFTDVTRLVFAEGPRKPFAFWLEKSEELLHLNPDKPMPIYFGLAKKDASHQEHLDVGEKLVTFLREKDFYCEWKDRENTYTILVNMNSHKPETNDSEYEPDIMEVRLFVPENEDTKDFSWNENIFAESGDGDGLDPNGYYFYQQINDGESLMDVLKKLDQKVLKHITHYQMTLDNGMTEDLSPVYEFNRILSDSQFPF